MNNEYVVINKTEWLEVMEKLEEAREASNDARDWSYISGKKAGIEIILSKSTPLIPEIEKAFVAGIDFTGIGNFRKGTKEYESYIDRKTYISNLKLDI